MMRLLIVDHMVKKPVGISYDVFVKVEKYIFLSNFIVMDCEVDFEIPTILGRSFLATGKDLVDIEKCELKFRMNNKKDTLNNHRTMKQPSDMRVVSIIHSINDPVGYFYGYLNDF